MLLRAWQGGKDTAVDFTISHSLQTAQKPWTAEKAKAFVTLQEKKKVAKYAEPCKVEGWNFIPAAFDTWGGMGPGAKELLRKMLQRAVCGVSLELRAARTQEHKQSLSLALMRQVWRLLGAKTTFCTHAGIQPCGHSSNWCQVRWRPYPPTRPPYRRVHARHLGADAGWHYPRDLPRYFCP